MKNKIFNKKTFKYSLITLLIVIIGIFSITFFADAAQPPKTQTADVKVVASNILASGSFAAQNQATLNFQIGGKLTYLPLKEGDTVYQGETIAQLDSYSLQKELQIAANTYQTSVNGANQASENQQAGVTEGQQRTSLDTYNKNGYSAIPETSVIYDTVKRLVDNANLAQNSAQLNVDLANYALSLASLTSPINGIILHEDVTTPNVNITPLTTFTVADPNSIVFSANVRQQDINFISVGNSATITLDGGNGQSFSGIVDRIYPQVSTDSNGESVYRVDIKINNLPTTVKFGQSGSVLIKSNFNQKVILVPSWAVLSDSYVWVLTNGKPVLKTVNSGSTFNGQTEILGGLTDTDKVITNPQSLLSNLYSIL